MEAKSREDSLSLLGLVFLRWRRQSVGYEQIPKIGGIEFLWESGLEEKVVSEATQAERVGKENK